MSVDKLKIFSRIEIDGFPTNPKPIKNSPKNEKQKVSKNVEVKETPLSPVIANDKNIK